MISLGEMAGAILLKLALETGLAKTPTQPRSVAQERREGDPFKKITEAVLPPPAPRKTTSDQKAMIAAEAKRRRKNLKRMLDAHASRKPVE